MKQFFSPLRRFDRAGLPAVFVALLWMGLGGQGGRPAADDPVLLVPFVTSDVRALVPIEAQVLVYNTGAAGEVVRVEGLRVVVDGAALVETDVGRELPGDPEYGFVNALIERLPDEVTELHRPRRYFAAEDAPAFAGPEALERMREVTQRVSGLRAKYDAGVPPPFVQPVFTLPLDQLFLPDDPKGTQEELAIEVDYADSSGARRVARVTQPITWLGPRPGPSTTLDATQGGTSVHAGDLHVHSCHGEATGACAPSGNCAAESFQTSGSFTYAQLKTQFQALGVDWFTATDHSYCINSDAEYQTIVAETTALTDAAFLVYPDIELSSDEEGPQQGSDLGDALCLGLTSANHMGAHGITTRLAGGGDAFLGFCDGLFTDVLDEFSSNAAAIRAQGGYPIVNHPQGSSFGWNSFQATLGIEAGQMHGVEVWNGGFQSGQGSHVGTWVAWLLGGRVLYAYSGSDTHDAAFDFGANHALLTGGAAFTKANVRAAVEAGRVYVSNGPSLVLEVDLGGATLLMGERHTLPAGAPASSLTVRAHYNFGTDTGTVTLFRGRAGDASETVLCQSGPLTGMGAFECAGTLASGQSWYRAYAQNQAVTETAYANPVFFLPGAGDVFTYCTAKESSQGCSPAIASTGTPSATAGSGFVISATELINNQNGLLIYGLAPNFLPFQGGTLCIAPSIVRTPVQPTRGNPGPPDCSGSIDFDFNVWIASGVDVNLTAGTTVFTQYWYRDPGAAFPSGLSNALQLTIQP